MRCCGSNKVFVGTLEHSHITSLLILGDRLVVGMATGTWLKPGARPESQCPEREHTHTKNVLVEGKVYKWPWWPQTTASKLEKSWSKTQQIKEYNIFAGKPILRCDVWSKLLFFIVNYIYISINLMFTRIVTSYSLKINCWLVQINKGLVRETGKGFHSVLFLFHLHPCWVCKWTD